jgi:hypothetical protein
MWTRIWAKNVVNPAAAGTSSEQRSEYGYDHNAHHDTSSWGWDARLIRIEWHTRIFKSHVGSRPVRGEKPPSRFAVKPPTYSHSLRDIAQSIADSKN